MRVSRRSTDRKDPPQAVETPATPDRTHCPPDEKVRALASGELSDPSVEEHVRECSWCSAEYRDHQRDLESNRFIKRSTYGLYVVILVIIVVEVLRSCHR